MLLSHEFNMNLGVYADNEVYTEETYFDDTELYYTQVETKEFDFTDF